MNNPTVSDLLETLEFGKSFLKTLRGSSAKVRARTAKPNSKFWEMYRGFEKEKLREAGISVIPVRGVWSVMQFERNGEFYR